MPRNLHRRQFIGSLAAVSSSFACADQVFGADPNWLPRWKSERLAFGGIGLRYQGSVDLSVAGQFGDILAVCDVDRNVRDQAKAALGSRPNAFEDYRDLLQQKNIDAVIIGTPDHWHTKIAADAMRSGKDVYVEKPLTLTVQEGQLLRQVAKETGRVVQVGSWQRSDSRFRLAVELVAQGRVGKLQSVEVVLGKNEVGGPFETRPVPGSLNWDLWQGQTPETPYIEERCHYQFRWWQEYSGGQMTDWGAHHIDIAQWAIDSLPVMIRGVADYPTTPNGFNVPIDFECDVEYANGVRMTVRDTGRNGILFTGERGRLFVNRGVISGVPVEHLTEEPLDRGDYQRYPFDNLDRSERAGKLDAIYNHMGNFVDCIDSRQLPISDIESQHRSVTTCHLANISMRLGRALKWDPDRERVIADDAANRMLQRETRAGFEIE